MIDNIIEFNKIYIIRFKHIVSVYAIIELEKGPSIHTASLKNI